MWCQDPGDLVQDLLQSATDCAELEIPMLVVHPWNGTRYTFCRDTLCFDHFDRLVDHCAHLGIQIAFENLEGPEYLCALMERYQNCSSVGFCWDSGHEMCYNYSEDMLARYGDRLLMTHLNDNLGISRFDGEIYWTDDLHLLPFDGIAEWDHNVERLKKARHLDILNFELCIHSKPNRHENDVYEKMPLAEYFAEAYKRACKIAYRYSK